MCNPDSVPSSNVRVEERVVGEQLRRRGEPAKVVRPRRMKPRQHPDPVTLCLSRLAVKGELHISAAAGGVELVHVSQFGAPSRH